MASQYFRTGSLSSVKSKGGGSENGAVDLLIKSYISQTPNGELSNQAETDGLVDLINKLPQTEYAQEKSYEYQAKSKQFGTNRNDLNNYYTKFNDDLKRIKASEMQSLMSGDGSKSAFDVIATLNAIYQDASYDYEQNLNDLLENRYGTADNVSQEALNYGDELGEKAAMINAIYTSYINGNGPVNPDAVAFVFDTNPTTGNIIDVDVQTTDKMNAEYLRTDTPLNVTDPANGQAKLPIYLRKYEVGRTDDGTKVYGANLFGIEYKAKSKKSENTDESVNYLEAVKDRKQGISRRDVRQAKNNGLTLTDAKFDATDVPTDSVVKVRNSLYYYSPEGYLMPIEGADNAEKEKNFTSYINGIGGDMSKYNLGYPYYSTPAFLNAPDGSYRVKEPIKDGMLNVQSSINSPDTLGSIPSTNTTVATTLGGGGTNPAPEQTTAPAQQTFFQKMQGARANKPETENGEVLKNSATGAQNYSVKDVVAKGKSFFADKFKLG